MFALLSPILTYRNKPTACFYVLLTWKIVTFNRKQYCLLTSHPNKTLLQLFMVREKQYCGVPDISHAEILC